MSDQYLGEIRIFGGNFAPAEWALCNGQLLPISQNTALFALLGTFYGGNGTSNFALPNLMGSVPMHQGAGAGLTPRSVGEAGGSQTVGLNVTQLPSHAHLVNVADTPGDANVPDNHIWAEAASGRVLDNIYSPSVPNVQMHPQAISSAGGSQAHNNMPPYLCLVFIIALQGIFPPRQ